MGTPGALHPDYIPVPKPEDEYVWYSIPVDRNSPQGNAANNDTSFQAKLASTRVRFASQKMLPLMAALFNGAYLYVLSLHCSRSSSRSGSVGAVHYVLFEWRKRVWVVAVEADGDVGYGCHH